MIGETTNSVTIEVKGIGHIPSFKNNKRAIMDKNRGHLRTLTDPETAKRMERLENAILCALYSESQIIGSETHSECWKRLRIHLSGLSDDSIREIPRGSWDIEYVSPGEEGVLVIIEEVIC